MPQGGIRGSLRNSSVDLSRYVRHKLGKTTQEIAMEDGVKEAAVKRSISTIDAYRATHTHEYLNESIVQVVMENKKNLSKALEGGLTATMIDDKGKKVVDHMVQLKAFDSAMKAAEIVQPKPQKGFSVNVNQQQAVAHSSPPPESGFVGYEERLRKIRTRIDQHNQLPSTTADVTDDAADIVEDEEVMVSAGSPDTQG